MAIYSGFSHYKWWFSIAMLNYQRVWKREAAARQAHTQLERLSLEQKSMILDQALQVR